MALALQSLAGVLLIPLLAYVSAAPANRLSPAAALRTIAAGLGVQIALALVLLKLPLAQPLFHGASAVLAALEHAVDAGMQLVFGYLAGGPAPFETTRASNSFLLAFRALPLIILISALTRLLYHWGILQRVVAGVAALLRRAFAISGPLGTAASATIFLGMVEGPLLIQPYLAHMSRGALLAMMSVGMATIAGTVMALYASILEPVLPGAAGHVLAASLMNAPAALLLARLVDHTGFSDAAAEPAPELGEAPRSAIDAIVAGTMDGVRLLVAVAAMLVVATALVALVNAMLGALSAPLGLTLTIERLLGWLAAPIAVLIGIPWSEASAAGALLGKKIVLNELVAYLDMVRLPPETLSPRSRLILTYALCGFANLASLGILVGGLNAMAPSRRDDVAGLGARALAIGIGATLLTGAVVGLVSGL